MTKEVVVSYLVCERCGEQGCHVENNRGQGVIPWTKRKTLSWCGCKGKKVEGGMPTERKAQQGLRKRRGPERQRHSRAAHGQENRKAQQERGVVERRSGEPSKC